MKKPIFPMKKPILIFFLVFIFVVLLGFYPNFMGGNTTSFTVPPNPSKVSYRGLPPGKYKIYTVAWFSFLWAVTVDENGKIVEIMDENRPRSRSVQGLQR